MAQNQTFRDDIHVPIFVIWKNTSLNTLGHITTRGPVVLILGKYSNTLTLCLLVSSADNLGKQFGPRSGAQTI